MGKLPLGRPQRRGACAAVVLLVSLWAAAHDHKNWPVPEEAKKLRNPVPRTDAVLQAARPLYEEKCAQCHGDTGKGDGPESIMYSVKPADLTEAHMMGQMTDGEIFWKISEGRPPMPSFKKQLSEEQRWQLVHILRTFARKPAAKPAAKSPAKHTHKP